MRRPGRGVVVVVVAVVVRSLVVGCGGFLPGEKRTAFRFVRSSVRQLKRFRKRSRRHKKKNVKKRKKQSGQKHIISFPQMQKASGRENGVPRQLESSFANVVASKGRRWRLSGLRVRWVSVSQGLRRSQKSRNWGNF